MNNYHNIVQCKKLAIFLKGAVQHKYTWAARPAWSESDLAYDLHDLWFSPVEKITPFNRPTLCPNYSSNWMDLLQTLKKFTGPIQILTGPSQFLTGLGRFSPLNFTRW